MTKTLLAAMVLFSATTMLSAGEFYYIAHRGEYMTLPADPAAKSRNGIVDAPEGTRPAFERVRDRQINGVKLDLQYTADKVIVISHDTSLRRTTGHDLLIAGVRYEDLKSVPFLKVGDFAEERIVTLDEALAIVKDCPLFYLDFKAYTPEMMDAAFKAFAAQGIPEEKIIIATFNREALKGAMQTRPQVRRVLHVSYKEPKNFDAFKAEMRKWKQELGLYGFNIPTSSPLTTPELVHELKADGNWVTLWYGHSTNVADQFRNSEIDGFVTGMPSALRAYLEDKPESCSAVGPDAAPSCQGFLAGR
jgi:glycerophosphoryl diester phosphodiesterase